MSTYGIRVSKDGIPIIGAATKDMVFDSESIHPKIYSIDRISGTSDEINHPFGYPVATAGYINDINGTTLDSSKWFYHYDLGFYRGYQFENTTPITGTIRTDSQKIYLSCNSSDRLVALTFADPALANFADTIANANNARKDTYGIKVSKQSIEADYALDYQLSVTSDFQTFSIVQSGFVNVYLESIATNTPTTDTVEQTAFVDINHSLGYAGHMVVFNEQALGNIGYYPGVIGVSPPVVFTDTEVYIDNNKIRFRVSRTAEALSGVLDASADAANYRFKYYLTNYNLQKV